MLDNNQLKAVNHYEGPCLTLAGPGSGKTTVLVSRIKNLMERYNVSGDSILVITFTKDAALEMKSRFISSTDNPKAGLVNFGTFHSIFYKILKLETDIDSNSILQGKSLILFIKEVIKSLDITFDEQLIESLYKEISYVNNTLISINEYESASFDTEDFRRIYREYQDMKSEFNKIDFDDMLFLTLSLFRSNACVLEKWQKRFRFFLIDEMQDMNDVQFDIIRLLAKSNNVFAVGDDDQSIYGFRGANPLIMQKFPEIYQGCNKIILSRNYRSSNEIVRVSSNLINHNELRFSKDFLAKSVNNGNVSVKQFRDSIEESEWICEEILSILRQDKNETVAILFRNKNLNHDIINALSDKGVAFFVKDKVSNIYNHFIFRDIMAYINLSVNGENRSDLLRIYNKPNRYINRKSLDKSDVTYLDMINYYNNKPYMKCRINDMKSDIHRIKTLRPASAILYIRKKIGYDTYIEEVSKSKQQYDDYMKVLDSVLNMSKGFGNINDFLDKCNKEIEFNNNDVDESHSKVFLYTFHASKGLEFDNVFVLDVNEGITPSKKAETIKDLEEERRMFYVAITRAKTNLILCSIGYRNNEKLFMSRFIEEMGV